MGKIVDLVVKNGKLVWPQKLIEGDIAIDNGIIVAVAKEPNLPKGDLIVDAKGKVIFPGILDCHSHTTLPPEDSCSGTRAAAKAASQQFSKCQVHKWEVSTLKNLR